MAKVSFVIKKGPRKGRRVTFVTHPGRKRPRRRSPYQKFVAKKVRAATKDVPKGQRMRKARTALKQAAKDWKNR